MVKRATDPGRVQVAFLKEIAVKRVRLQFDTSRSKRHTGIDTVQLVGSDGTSHWPIDARVIK